MQCLLPIMFILNTDASVIKEIRDYKLPDPHVEMALKLCKERVGTCPSSVSIFPSGHVHILCKRKTNESN